MDARSRPARTRTRTFIWAIRGGGGNFGIVTAFEVALHPVSKVFRGHITLDSADPREFLQAFRDFLLQRPTS